MGSKPKTPKKKYETQINKTDSDILVKKYLEYKVWKNFFKDGEVVKIKKNLNKTQIKEHIYNKARKLVDKTQLVHGKVVREMIVNEEINNNESPPQMDETPDKLNEQEKELFNDEEEIEEINDTFSSEDNSEQVEKVLTEKQKRRQENININKNLKYEQINEIREARRTREESNRNNSYLQLILMNQLNKLNKEEISSKEVVKEKKRIILQVETDDGFKIKMSVNEDDSIEKLIENINKKYEKDFKCLLDEEEYELFDLKSLDYTKTTEKVKIK
jgi:hypothetical protein